MVEVRERLTPTEGDLMAAGAGAHAHPAETPAEYLIDNLTIGTRMKEPAWQFIRDRGIHLGELLKDEGHVLVRVIPSGRALVIGGVSVLGIAGSVYLCNKLLKHKHNPLREDKK